MKNAAKTYDVLADGWPKGHFRKKGDVVELTDDEAKYLVMSGLVAPAKPKPPASPAKPPFAPQAAKSEPKLPEPKKDQKN